MDYCQECGAPVVAGPAAEGSDAAIYPELARANLLRMRGDFKAAADQCRSILRKFPNNGSANVLLGDIHAEQGDLEQAREWYELALDLMPDSVGTQQKLATVRHRIEQEANKSVADQIGLPAHANKSPWPVVATVLGVLIVVAIAYVAGAQVQKRTDNGPSVGAPISAPAETSGGGQPLGQGEPNKEQTTVGGTSAAGTGAQEDAALSQLVAQRGPDGGHLMGLAVDPRTGLLTLTYRVSEGENERALGASLARTAFEQSPNTQVITLRGVRNGSLVYVADARREAYTETETDAWKQQNSNDPNAWINHMLTQEWTPNGAPPPDTPATNQPTTTGGPDSLDPNPPGTGVGSQGSATTGG